jgi:GT2 family glycosyltransferase
MNQTQNTLEEKKSVAIEKALVSLIILNWNGKHLLDRCLASVLSQTYPKLEILVVDNGSKDGSVDYLRSQYPQVNIVVNSENLGFCGGNNVGLRQAKGDYIVLLNNDAVLGPHCIEELHKTIEKDKGVGCVASKILLADGSNKIDAAGIAICLDGLSIGRGRTESGDKYNEEAEVFFASDCCCIYRKELLADIGLYDEDFFAYAEETDMGWRSQLRGWRCLYNPRAVVYHEHSSSLGSYSPFKVFLVERNRIWVAFKNLPFKFLVKGLAYTFQRYFYQATGAFTGKGAAGEFAKSLSKWQLAWILIKAYTAGIAGLPKMVKKRKEILENRRISDHEIEELFRRYGMKPRAIAFTS